MLERTTEQLEEMARSAASLPRPCRIIPRVEICSWSPRNSSGWLDTTNFTKPKHSLA